MKPLDPRLLRRAGVSRRFLAISLGIAVTSGGLLVVAAFAVADLIVRPFQSGADLADVRGPLTVLALAVAFRAVLAWGAQVTAHRVAADVKSQLRRDVLCSVVRLGPAWLARRRAGDLATLVSGGTDALDDYFAQFLPAMLAAVFVPVLMTATVLSQDVTAGLIVLGTLPLIPLFGALIGHRTERATRRQWRTLAALGGHFLDVVEGLPTLLLFGRAQAQVAKIRERAEHHRRATMATLRVSFLSSAALDFVATISVALVAVSIGLRLVSGSLDLRTGLIVLVLAPEAYRPLRDLAAQFHSSAAGVAAVEAMYAVIDAAAPRAEFKSDDVRSIDLTRTTLRVDGVTVRYERNTPALAPLDLVVQPGEYLGVAGPSGSGKTTLLWVLLGFVTPTAGRVLLDGPGGTVDLADVDLALWRSQLVWVPQEPWLARASIADNVLLARPSAGPAEVTHALRSAEATEFVDKLPNGANTVLGEGGAGLSAGERQRIAIARAFLRDVPLVLLDEPTAHLDAVSEAAVASALRRLARDRTVIAVAHRPALLADCDRVVRLDGVPERAIA